MRDAFKQGSAVKLSFLLQKADTQTMLWYCHTGWQHSVEEESLGCVTVFKWVKVGQKYKTFKYELKWAKKIKLIVSCSFSQEGAWLTSL